MPEVADHVLQPPGDRVAHRIHGRADDRTSVQTTVWLRTPGGAHRPFPATGGRPSPEGAGDRTGPGPMALLHRYAALEVDAPERDTIMEQLVSTFLPVVEQVVARYAGRHHTSREDLVQTGAAAMVAAIDRWDPARAKGDFLGYLVPCVRGEIKRYFRDRTWAASVPRPVKDLGIAIGKASDPLTQRLGRAPRPSELADALGVGPEDVVEALAAKADQHATPLFAVDDETGDTYDTLGAVDAAFGHIEDQEILRPLVVRLTAREQRILVLRFFEDRTQSEIGAELGLSQMHVSRLLSRTLATLRRGLEDADRRRPDPPRSA